jgi:acyl carrier protein
VVSAIWSGREKRVNTHLLAGSRAAGHAGTSAVRCTCSAIIPNARIRFCHSFMGVVVSAYSKEEVVARIEGVLRSTLELGPDVELRPEADLLSEIGLDSIEAFEAVTILHEILGVRIPDDLDPKTVASINGMADYIIDKYGPEVVDKFMTIDIDNAVKEMRSDESL